MATPNFPNRQLVSTPWDQLLAETETEYEEDETKTREPMPLHIRVQTRCQRSWVDIDEAAAQFRVTKNNQSHHVERQSTSPSVARSETDILKECVSEIQYMACWEGSTRGNAEKNPLREVILRVNSGCAKLGNPDKKRLLELLDVLVQIYYRILGNDDGPSAKSKHCYHCLDRLEFM